MQEKSRLSVVITSDKAKRNQRTVPLSEGNEVTRDG